MKKIKMLVILIFLSICVYSQSMLDKNSLFVLDSLVGLNDIKGLKDNKKELSIYIIRGVKKIDYLVIKYRYDTFYNYFFNEDHPYSNLRKLDEEEKLELFKVRK